MISFITLLLWSLFILFYFVSQLQPREAGPFPAQPLQDGARDPQCLKGLRRPTVCCRRGRAGVGSGRPGPQAGRGGGNHLHSYASLVLLSASSGPGSGTPSGDSGAGSALLRPRIWPGDRGRKLRCVLSGVCCRHACRYSTQRARLVQSSRCASCVSCEAPTDVFMSGPTPQRVSSLMLSHERVLLRVALTIADQ